MFFVKLSIPLATIYLLNIVHRLTILSDFHVFNKFYGQIRHKISKRCDLRRNYLSFHFTSLLLTKSVPFAMLKFVVCLLGVFSVLCQSVGAEPKWTAKFDPPWAGLSIGMNEKFILTIKNLNTKNLDPKAIRVFSSNTDVVSIAEETIFKKIKGGALNGTFEVVPVGLGEATLFVEITRGKTTEQSPRTMKVMVRRNRLPSVASMIARYLHSADITYYFFVFLFFNFGVILSVENLKSIMIRPTGVFIAFVLIFLLVPVVSNHC